MARYGNADETDPVRPTQYITPDIIITFTSAPTPYSCSSLSYGHRFMGFFHRQTSALVTHSERPIDYRVSDRRVVFTPELTPDSCSSPSHTQNSRLLTLSLSLGLPVPRVTVGTSVCETHRSISFSF
jgi:hypothetical protein